VIFRLSPFLNEGFSSAYFKWSGKTPDDRDSKLRLERGQIAINL
jgi:hypothetical protein